MRKMQEHGEDVGSRLITYAAIGKAGVSPVPTATTGPEREEAETVAWGACQVDRTGKVNPRARNEIALAISNCSVPNQVGARTDFRSGLCLTSQLGESKTPTLISRNSPPLGSLALDDRLRIRNASHRRCAGSRAPGLLICGGRRMQSNHKAEGTLDNIADGLQTIGDSSANLMSPWMDLTLSGRPFLFRVKTQS